MSQRSGRLAVVVIAPKAELGGMRLDGEPITTTWVPVGTSNYSGTQIQVTSGHH